MVDQEKLDEIYKLFKKFKGKFPVYINFLAKNYLLETKTEHFRIEINQEFFSAIDDLGIEAEIKSK